jgi:hypothetical protein
MTASQSHKSARRARRLSTGHDRARPDIRSSAQIVGQLLEFDAIRCAFISHFTVEQPVASARSKSASSLAALKSP